MKTIIGEELLKLDDHTARKGEQKQDDEHQQRSATSKSRLLSSMKARVTAYVERYGLNKPVSTVMFKYSRGKKPY